MDGPSEEAPSSYLALSKETLRARSAVPIPSSVLYAAMDRVGLNYLAKFQVLTSIRQEGSLSGQAYAQIGGQENGALNGMYTHPSALDGCLQLGATSLVENVSDEDQQTQVPAGIDAFVAHRHTASTTLHAVAKTTFSSAQKSISQHGLQDPNGRSSSTVYNLLTKSMSSSASGVMSLPVKPVPPVVIIASIFFLFIQSFKIKTISSLLSLQIFLSIKL